jgi:hypothetical protein
MARTSRPRIWDNYAEHLAVLSEGKVVTVTDSGYYSSAAYQLLSCNDASMHEAQSALFPAAASFHMQGTHLVRQLAGESCFVPVNRKAVVDTEGLDGGDWGRRALLP